MGPGSALAMLACPGRRACKSKHRIHVRDLAARFARGLPVVSPSMREQGMPDARCTRGLVCEVVQKKLHTSIQGSGEHPTFPAQWLDGLWRDHPGEFMAFVASVASRKPARQPGRACSTSARLDAYQFQASGPHAFAVRSGTARQPVPEPLTEFTRPAVPFRARCRRVHRNSCPNVR